MLVEDNPFQRIVWRSRIFSFGLLPYFHLSAARMVRRFDPADTVLHYLCPISPVVPRHQPKGYRTVVGPLNGNIYHPPGFKHREAKKRRLIEALQKPTQSFFGVIFGDKKRADTVLVSGHERTRASLRWAGVPDDLMVDVMDSGVDANILADDEVHHLGRNAKFISVARLMRLKAIDLIIRAIAKGSSDSTLTVVGDGPELGQLTELARHLGVADRVDFRGHVDHAELILMCKSHRALVFPSLCEANGIAMQEAMAVGLPVIALNWGGQAALADRNSAIFVEPTNEDQVVQDLATEMNRVAEDHELAERISRSARQIALERFAWDTVAASWTAPYADQIPARRG